jgi:hypothetical protein
MNSLTNLYYPKGVTDEDFYVLKFSATGGNDYHNLANHSFAMEELNHVKA